jgi:hypothetical protein
MAYLHALSCFVLTVTRKMRLMRHVALTDPPEAVAVELVAVLARPAGRLNPLAQISISFAPQLHRVRCTICHVVHAFSD